MTGLLPKQKPQFNLLQLCGVITLAINLFTLLAIVYQGLIIRNITNQKPPTFIEVNSTEVNNLKLNQIKSSNNPITIQKNILEREPEAIRQFVSTTMIGLFNWTGNLPPQTIEEATNPQPDLGINVRTPQGYNKRIASSSWVASFALSKDFRQDFLAQIADMTPADIFSRNQNQKITAQLIIKRVYPPEQIAEGNWRIGMVADIVQQRSDKQRLITPFNKDFLVRAVEAFEYPLKQQLTPRQQAVYKLRSQKLEIYEITDLCLNDVSNRCQNISSQLNQNKFTD